MQLHEYVAAVGRRWAWILLAGLVGAASCAAVATASPATYESTASVYVGVERVRTDEDLASGSLVRRDVLPTVVELIGSSVVLGPVVDRTGLPVSPAELSGRVSAVALEDTSVVDVTVTAPTATEAVLLAREIGEQVGEVVPSLYPDGDGAPVLEATTIGSPQEPRAPASAGTLPSAALGLLAGLALAALGSGLAELLRPRIRTVDDVTGAGGPRVLGSLPAIDRGRTGEGAGAARREAVTRLLWSLTRRSAVAHAGHLTVTGTPAATTLAAELRRPGGPDVVPVPAAGLARRPGPVGEGSLVLAIRTGRTTRGQFRSLLAAADRSPGTLLGVVLDGALVPDASWRARARAVLRGEALLWHVRPARRSGASLASRLVAVAALLLVGAAVPLPFATNSGLLAAAALLPVWVSVLPRFRGAVTLAVLSGVGLVSGALLAVRASADHDLSAREAAESGFVVLAAVGAVGLLLWARTLLPLWAVAATYGVGQLATALLDVPASPNPYKYELALPLTIVVLALVGARRRPLASLAALAVLGALDILSDARSAFTFCLAAMAVVVWQARPVRSGTGRGNRWRTVAALVTATVGGYLAVTQLLVTGVLGAEVQARSITQIEQSGSLLLGGRPEWTATLALFQERPLGYGLGTLPTAHDVSVAAGGFASTNIPTAEGYIQNYMFARGIELHSVLADLWAHLGVAGVVLALAMAVLLIRGLVDLLARRRADALSAFLVVSGLWYLAFGPLPANLPDIAFALGLVLGSRDRPAGSDDPAAGERGDADRLSAAAPVAG